MTPTKNQPNYPSHPAKNATATFTNPNPMTMAAACAFHAGREDMRKGWKMTEFIADDLRKIETAYSDELASLRRDAERYAKLRAGGVFSHCGSVYRIHIAITLNDEPVMLLGDVGEFVDSIVAFSAMEAADAKP